MDYDKLSLLDSMAMTGFVMDPDHPHPKAMRASLYGAQQFVLDEDSSKWVVDTMHDPEIAQLVHENAEFARWPYPKTYLELDFGPAPGHKNMRKKGGLITNENMAWMFINTPRGASFGGVVYPGIVLYNITYYLDRDYMECFPKQGLSEETAKPLLEEFTGGLRFFQLALLLMSNPTRFTGRQEPRKSVKRKGRRVVYMAKTVVSLNLLSKPAVKRAVATGLNGSPRRHMVRGHWAHRPSVSPACEHVYTPAPNDEGHVEMDETTRLPKRYRCARCARLRYWVASHARGDAERGWVGKEKYEVAL